MGKTVRLLPAIAVEKSTDRKLSVGGRCSATYASLHSCPECKLAEACYALTGHTGITVRALTALGKYSAKHFALTEAAAIRQLSGRWPLRLHVSGDCKTPIAARIVAEASRAYTLHASQPVWTYTHAWRRVPRAAWNGVSVLASCETLADVKHAHKRGFAAALVVSEYKQDTAYRLDSDFVGIPCPEQTGKAASCSNCRLCWNADKLHKNRRVILFAAHSANAKLVPDVVEL